MSRNYENWNDTSVAHMFIRLINKINHPYNNDKLTLNEFNKDYDLLQGYIEWRHHKYNNFKTQFSLYNYSYNNLNELMNLINYEIDNKTELLNIWNNKILGYSV